jgi:UDP-N-acetylglucosamine 4,6-dehydratase/5-epimerase
MIKNKKIIITGGAGFLGKAIVHRLYEHNDICIYSRDEAKHYFLQKQYPRIRSIIGSICDKDRLIRSCREYNMGIFAASLKQISACDENPVEAINTICLGAINSRLAAEDNNFEAACLISTDKACEASTIYGSCKYTAEQSFIVNNSDVRLSSCRYGNVTNSTGSVIPVILDSIKQKRQITLYSDTMTRFMIDIEEAVDLVTYSLNNVSGSVVVPKLRSFLVKDMFDLYSEHMGLKYIIGQPRVGEKLHEIMVGKEEVNRAIETDQYIIISPDKINTNPTIKKEYCSDQYVMSKNDLYTNLVKVGLI